MARLDILQGPHAGQSLTFTHETFLGYNASTGLCLAETNHSHQQAHIVQQDGRFTIQDLHSGDGTWVGAQRLAPETPYVLKDGDEIQLGPVRLLFRTAEDQEALPSSQHRFFRTMLSHPYLSLGFTLLVAACFMAFVPQVKTVNNVDYFTLQNNHAIEFYKSFKAVFGEDEFFVVAVQTENIFTTKYLRLLQDLTEALEALAEVREVKSLANVNDVIGGENTFEVQKFLADIPETDEALERLRAQAVTNPLYVRSFISPDARTAALVVFPHHNPEDEKYRQHLLTKVAALLEPYRKAGEELRLAGWTVTNLALSHYMQTDLAWFIPLTYLCITVTIWLMFGSGWITLLAVLNIAICTGSVMGLFGLSGITINNFTTIAIPLIMALCLSDTVHIFAHLDRRVLESSGNPIQALARILHRVVRPCLLTSITTLVGFASLAVSDVISMREFAFIASSGMAFEFFYSFFFIPPLIVLLPAHKIYRASHGTTGNLVTGLVQRLNALIQRHSQVVLGSIGVFVLLCGWLLTSIKVETNLTEYFKASSPLRQDVAFMEQHVGGIDSLDISLKAHEIDAFHEPVHLQLLETLQQYIQALPGIDLTLSLVDFLKDMHQSFHNEEQRYYRLPESKELVAQYLLLYSATDLEKFVNAQYNHARIAIRTSIHNSAEQTKLIRAIERYIATLPHAGLDIQVTGRVVQDIQIIDALVHGQIDSLGVGTLVIGLLMCLVLRSFSIGLLSLLPNIFPIIANFGIMGALGIPLNNATAMIASIALGMSVDSNIHFLSEYRQKRAMRLTVRQAVAETMADKGRAVLSSSFILSIGFGVLMLASFVPTIQFGALSMVVMFLNIIDDLFFLPALLLQHEWLARLWKSMAPGHASRTS